MGNNSSEIDAMQASQEIFDEIQIKYDGLKAHTNHEIDLHELGKSIQGLSKIISTIADYCITGNYQSDKRNLSCKVYAKETKANCFSIMAVIEVIDKSPTLTTFAGTAGATIFTGVLAYSWAFIAGRKEEMKALKESLEKAIEQLGRKDDTSKMLAIIEKISLALIPAAKDAVKPIGDECETVSLGSESAYFATWDKKDKSVINGEDFSISEKGKHKVLIDEFDMRKKTCKISPKDDLRERYSAKITDPQADLANNKYALAMANKAIVTIEAKIKSFERKKSEFIISDIEYDNT